MSKDAFPVTERFQPQLSLSNNAEFPHQKANTARPCRCIHPDYS
jgi:hypothetical protein